ncbi:hybrid sensor histidine kinase/response regulator [Paracoccus liaowanqingii]|uniref:histidine kinase n=1 Tax=Paracoccus liaowanqingii TaxID=2560053 RepID=A0A4P7HNW0_9RHOB|nr:hybrid sensor histidine kinase/response regulator [Paracoccus liaowanqingii]QBX35976.1 hybrid sensor histidine kinase/response regulator [Paracoccus liaowanqingii]TGN62453.1 hybrid sensor histidine kinase/response regulator [Paracoccus liaowanqingii]
MLRDDDPPDRQVQKLTRITQVLIDRIDRLEEKRGSAWSTFQAAVALEQEVLARTRDLERAMADLSQRNRELAVARASAEEANRSKTRFLRAASHDLLQPLSAARLFLSALADTPMDENQAELTDRLGSAFESVEQLMHAVLDISRLDSARIEFNRQPVALDELFRRLAAEFAPVAHAKGLRLAFMPTGAVVDSDPIFLRRIAQNLVSNAIKYTQRGGVAVGARKRGGMCWLSVYDTGIGIPAVDRNRIFDEFQRLTHDQATPGMGLGLSIVRRACAKLDHPISLSSEAMRGTVFRVGLPLVGADPDAAPRLSDTALPALRGRVALVVENDPDMRRGYEMILRDRLGMVPRLAGGTAEALATMGDEPPDVILADYHLENGDTGFAAIEALRAAAGRPVPAVMVTAHRDPGISRSCARMGMHLLEKPVRPAELAEILARLLA